MREFAADAVIETDPACYLLRVGANLGEGDLGGEEGVGCVFDQFGGAPAAYSLASDGRRAAKMLCHWKL